ncbi:hypothetical protein D3C71_2129460 [compost metagenome]
MKGKLQTPKIGGIRMNNMNDPIFSKYGMEAHAVTAANTIATIIINRGRCLLSGSDRMNPR